MDINTALSQKLDAVLRFVNTKIEDIENPTSTDEPGVDLFDYIKSGQAAKEGIS